MVFNEISIMRTLSHPFICKLFEVFESENSLYLILELADGGDLFTRLAERSSLTEEMISLVLSNILITIQYLHSQGIIHRDLKPQNILIKSLREDFDIRIIDFGLSMKKPENPGNLVICGTPGFIAPEVFSNNSYSFDGKSDVFSIGVMFFIMLTGESPFEGKNRGERLEKNRKCEIDFEKTRTCSKKARILLRKMLDLNPKQRLSAKECLESDFFLIENKENIEEKYLEEGVFKNMKKFIEFSINFLYFSRF